MSTKDLQGYFESWVTVTVPLDENLSTIKNWLEINVGIIGSNWYLTSFTENNKYFNGVRFRNRHEAELFLLCFGNTFLHENKIK